MLISLAAILCNCPRGLPTSCLSQLIFCFYNFRRTRKMPSDETPQVAVKTENGSSYKRLPSFRSPRDLKLSQFRELSSGNSIVDGRPKKVFVPNLNVHRKKAEEREENRPNDAESPTTPGDTSGRGRGSFDRGRGRGRGGKRSKEFIQQAGVFSQGLAPSMKPSWGSKNHDSSPSIGIPKPKLRLNESQKVNKEEEEAMMKELLRDDFIDDPNIEADFDNAPVELPLQDVCKWEHFKEEKPDCEMEYGTSYTNGFMNDVKVKPDPELIESGLVNGTNESKPVDVRSMRPLSLSQLLSTSQEKNFLFFQIPHRIPQLKMNVNSSLPFQRKPEDRQAHEEIDEASVLRSLPPGRIGTLQIRKSGRAVLVLGDVHLNVQSGTQSAFKQELVSVNLENSSKTGNMINMGTITTRILVTPDWERLLKSSK